MKNKRKLKEILSRYPKRRIIVIGETMLDRFVRGKVSRISPEAPVPVVRVTQEKETLGGAGNVAKNIKVLGAQVSLITVAGADAAGKRMAELADESGISPENILFLPEIRTIEKTRVIAEHQQVVRFDMDPAGFRPGKKESARILSRLKEEIKKGANAVIISDYGKGMLTPTLIREIIRVSRRAHLPVCVDPKTEHFRRYRKVTCITPNTLEAFGGMHIPPKAGQKEINSLGIRIIKALNLEFLLITQGENGMTLFKKTGRGISNFHIPTKAREVYDVTGAGDTVISTFTLTLASGATPLESAIISNYAAGVAVSKLGTAAVSRDEILEYVQKTR